MPTRPYGRSSRGRERALEIARYFELVERVDEWIFTGAPPEVRQALPPLRTPYFHRTLSWWLNAVIDAALRLERVGEARASEQAARECPKVADTRLVPCFLHLRCRRPERRGHAA